MKAEKTGCRPHKRCRPDMLVYQQIKETAEKVKSLIDTNFIGQKVLNDEIGQIGLAHHRIVNIFREYYGVTPKNYYDTLRLEEAKKKLITTNDSVMDIAYRLGFQSLSAFYAFFRKNMKSSPLKFRKENAYGIFPKD